MKVALCPSSFHPHLGGVEEVVLQLAREQVRRGDAPLVLTNRWPKTLPEFESMDGLPVYRFAFRVPEANWRQLGGAILFGPSTLRRMVGVIRAHRAEVIHVHCVSSNAHYALRAKRLTGLPLVVTLHAELTMDASGLFQKSKFAQELMRRALLQADVVTACSGRTLEDAEKFLGHDLGECARVIYNGTDTARFRREPYQANACPYLFALGRMVPQKGFDILLRAYAAVRARGVVSHELWIAGEGSEEFNLRQLAGELGLNGSVRFLGRIERQNVPDLLVGCAIHVMPSRCDEGLPMVLLESMSAGKPAVASRMGGIPELVRHGETGLLVERENIEELAEALAALIQSPTRLATMGAAALAKAEEMSWSTIAENYESVYQEALNRDFAGALS